MKLSDDSGSELKIERAVHQIADTFADRRDIKRRQSDSLSIFFRRVFDIHRNIVHKSSLTESAELFGKGSVRVKLDKIAHILDFRNEILHALVDERLSAADADPVKNASALFEK